MKCKIKKSSPDFSPRMGAAGSRCRFAEAFTYKIAKSVPLCYRNTSKPLMREMQTSRTVRISLERRNLMVRVPL